MKILILYAELMSYTEACIEELLERGNTVDVVHWDKKKLTPYEVTLNSKGLRHYPRRRFYSIMPKLIWTKWDIIIISGWQDKSYLIVAFFQRIFFNAKVFSCFDDKWFGTVKQKLGASIFKIFRGFLYTHAWVAGSEQYDYARNLHFIPSRIATGLLFADMTVFSFKNLKKKEVPKKFLFVGRLEKVKGIDILLSAWQELAQTNWELHIVGSGSYSDLIRSRENVVFHGFKNSKQLANIMNDCTVFIMPSRREPWGVVLQEAVLCGLPVICSNEVSSKECFVVNQKNGLLIKPEKSDLVCAMRYFMNMSEDDMLSYSQSSLDLAHSVNAETSVNNLYSVL